MKLHEAIGAKLLNTAAIQALVGARIYPLFAYQEDETPLIVWQFSIQPGVDLAHDLVNKARLSADCIADDVDKALEIAYALKAALHVTNATWGTVSIQKSRMESLDIANVDQGDGTHVVAARIEFSLQYDGES